MTDWATIWSLATAGGTLLAGSRLGIDPEQKIMFVDEHWVSQGLGRAPG